MPTLTSQDQVIATLVYSPLTGKTTVLRGNQTNQVSEDHNWFVVTERQLMEMNGFMQDKWQDVLNPKPLL